MKFTAKYYGNEKSARTPAGAIRAVKQLVKTYGQGNRPPIIDAATEDDAAEMVKQLELERESYCVRVNGIPVI